MKLLFRVGLLPSLCDFPNTIGTSKKKAYSGVGVTDCISGVCMCLVVGDLRYLLGLTSDICNGAVGIALVSSSRSESSECASTGSPFVSNRDREMLP